MAMGRSELTLILRLQQVGSMDAAKVRRDLDMLGRATKTANLNQLAAQKQMIRGAEQLAKANERVATLEQGIVNKRLALQSKLARAEAGFNRQRIVQANKQVALTNAIAAKEQQILRSKGTLGNMQGSGTMRFGLQDSRILTQRMNLENRIGGIQRSGIGLEAQAFRNRAATLEIERKLAAAKINIVELDAADAEGIQLAGHNLKVLGLRYQAVQKDAEKIAATQAAMPAQIAAVESQLVTVLRQEELISQQKFEQAAAVGRQAELIGLQEGQLQAIIARQGEIEAAIAAIDKEEALVNSSLAEQLGLLEKENAQLDLAKLSARQLAADFALVSGELWNQAKAADAANVAQNRRLKFQTGARTVGHIGRTAQFAGLIGVAAFAGAANSAAAFSRETTLAATQARAIGAPLAQTATRSAALQTKILSLMQKFPASAQEMSQAAYDIYSSMNVSFKGGQNLLTVFNKLAVATGTDLPTATNAGITVLNDFAGAGDNLNKTLNLMVSIIRFGRLNLTQFNTMLNKIAPAAAASGQRLQDVAGAIAAITRLQPSQPQGATGIARLLQTFRDPDFQKGVFKFGVDITKGAGAVGRLKPLPIILNEMAKSFGLFTSHGGPGQLFKELTATGAGSGAGRQSRIEAINAYTLLIKNIKLFNQLQGQTLNDTTEFDKAFRAMINAPGTKWSLFINQMKAFIIIIGTAALPVLLGLATHIQNAVNWFQHLSRHTRDLIVKIGVFTAVAALIGGTFLAIVAPIAGFIGTLLLMNKVLGPSGGAGLLGRLGSMAGLLEVLAGIGTIAIGIKLTQKGGGWGFIGRLLEGIGARKIVGKLAGKAAGKFAGPLAPFIEALVNPDTTKDAAKSFGNVEAIIRKLPQPFANQAQTIFESVLGKGGGSSTPGQAAKAAQAVASFLESVGIKTDKHTKKTKSLADQIKDLTKKFNGQTLAEKTAQLIDQAYGKQTDKTTNSAKKAAAASEKAARASEALANKKDAVTRATQRLQAAEEAAAQQLRGIFGTIGQGPILSGPLGQIFSNLNQTLAGFGAEPIPIPVSLIFKDQAAQQRQFDLFTADLSKLAARKTAGKGGKKIQAIPEFIIKQFIDQGISALPMIESLRHMTPAQWKKEVKILQREAKTLRKARDLPFEKELLAANIQLQAAKLNLAIAQRHFGQAKGKSDAAAFAASLVSAADKHGGHVKTHVVHYHGDTFNVPVSESQDAFTRYMRRRDFSRRTKGKHH